VKKTSSVLTDPADLSSVTKAVLALNPSLLQKTLSVFPLEPISVGLTGALMERLRYLDPILDFLEEECAKFPRIGAYRDKEHAFKNFDRRMVINILLACFLPALLAKEKQGRAPSRKILEQKVIDLVRVLMRHDLDSATTEALLHEGWKTKVSVDQQKAWKKWTSEKCPATSLAITTLGAYLSRCTPFRTAYPHESKVWVWVGIIVQSFVNPFEGFAPSLSTPRVCLACGQEHAFRGWRAVRARSQRGKRRRFQVAKPF
jgi:hypothetical protein